MEEVLCAMALKALMAGRHTTHKPGFMCAVQALKSAGERNTHGRCRYGDLRETARAREVVGSSTSSQQQQHYHHHQ
jgi:hypothetical protein